MVVLIRSEKIFVAIMGKSLLRNPYQIQRPRPQNKMTKKNIERSSAFLVRINFMSCGRSETAVKIPAIMPTYWVILLSFKMIF
jgi:hypothetical protein